VLETEGSCGTGVRITGVTETDTGISRYEKTKERTKCKKRKKNTHTQTHTQTNKQRPRIKEFVKPIPQSHESDARLPAAHVKCSFEVAQLQGTAESPANNSALRACMEQLTRNAHERSVMAQQRYSTAGAASATAASSSNPVYCSPCPPSNVTSSI
jgi:hypothetical protein